MKRASVHAVFAQAVQAAVEHKPLDAFWKKLPLYDEVERVAQEVPLPVAVRHFRALDSLEPTHANDRDNLVEWYYKKLSARAMKRATPGKPFQVTAYHGYNPGGSVDEGIYGKGLYFSQREAVARSYAHGGRVIRARIRLEKPYVMWEDKSFDVEGHTKPIQRRALARGLLTVQRNELQARRLTRALQYRGYDGIVMANPSFAQEIVVFNPAKSIRSQRDLSRAGKTVVQVRASKRAKAHVRHLK